MLSKWAEELEGWSILPRAWHIRAWWLIALIFFLVMAGAVFAPPGYAGLGDGRSPAKICQERPYHDVAAEQILGCGDQLKNRDEQLIEVNEDLDTACTRREHLYGQLTTKTDSNTRSTLREEEAEISQLFRELRELTGPKVWEETTQRLFLMLVTVLLGIGTILCVGRHARSIGIKRMTESGDAYRPFLISAGFTLLVAILVTTVESLDPDKTGYDWSSYCLAGPLTFGARSTHWVAGASFWLEHATLPALSALTGIQIVAGWYVTAPEFAPNPDPKKPHWGVRRYVTFLQIWCFSIVVLVGLIAAVWMHGLVASRTNVETFFLGTGALPPVVWLIGRFLRNALKLRDRCDEVRELAEKPAELPPDPTDGLLSVSWWQVPTLFASAFGIASALLKWGGLGRLFGAP